MSYLFLDLADFTFYCYDLFYVGYYIYTPSPSSSEFMF